ncbi:MAG: hypothetical protein ACYDBJ_00335 [Aggregatilineales bacterium]
MRNQASIEQESQRHQHKSQASKANTNVAPLEPMNALRHLPGGSMTRQLRQNAVLGFQQQFGNRAVQRMLASHRAATVVIQRDDDDDQDVPATSQPADSQPSTSQPDDSQPSTSQPDDSQPDDDQPGDTNSDDSSGDAGEVSYGLAGDTRSMPSVTDYGKAGIFDAEGYCKWDNIDSNSNNDQIVTTTLPNKKIKATGTTVMTFTSTAEYTLPSVPAAITNSCERAKYQTAIDTTLRAHEEKHKAAFLTYNGTASAQVNVTADDNDALLAAVSAATLTPTTDARYDAAKKKSSDVDPKGGFVFQPDLSGCDKK